MSLQVQMVLGSEGNLLNRTTDVTIKLKYPESGSDVIMWQKVYEDMTLVDGVLHVNLSGSDDTERELVAEMFDQEDITLGVVIDGNEVALDLVSQPYAIKSRISDESHSTRALNGVELEEVTELVEGDILIVKDGKWVASSRSDGYTGIVSALDRGTSVETLSDVNIEGLIEGEILGYDGQNWVNIADQKLSESDVNEIVSEKGFLKEVSVASIAEGEYDRIKGIGGKIVVDPIIQLNDNVNVRDDLNVGGKIGSHLVPVKEIYASSMNIGSIVLKESDGIIESSGGIRISDRRGELISGEGQVNRLGVYESSNELGAALGLEWDANKGQLGIGG